MDYSARGEAASQSSANGWTRSWTHNALGQTTLLANTDGTSSASYGGTGTSALLYDGAGNLTRETAFLGTGQLGNGTTQYSYDQNDRLSQESSTRWNHQSASYGFDSAYNRTSTGGSTSDQTWSETLTSNTKNQILARSLTSSSAGNFAYSYDYDDEGNRTQQVMTPQGGTSTTRTFAYDQSDHLTGVTEQTGTATPVVRLTAGYRADGLRAWKQTPQHGRTYFFYDGDALLAEMDDTGALTSVSTWGADGLVSKRVATATGPTTRYYAFDPRGNLATRTDAAGGVTDRPLSTAYSGESIQGETTSTFAGQAGGYYDEETGLILFGQRYYDASTGTWLTRDPIAEAGGINIYSYVKGNPVNGVDPTGKDIFGIGKRFGDWVNHTLLGERDGDPVPDGTDESEIEYQENVRNHKFIRGAQGSWKTGADIVLSAPMPEMRLGVGVGKIATVGKAGSTVTSSIGKSTYATRLASRLGGPAQADVDLIVTKLLEGRLQQGIGTRALGGGFFELRGANAGRVIVKDLGNSRYDIVGKFQGHVRGDAENSRIINTLIRNYSG